MEDTYLSLQDIEDLFGPAVARIVEGETKVSKLPKKVGFISKSTSPTDKQTENLCHLFFAMSEDWRVLMVKLADRLHNMRTIQVSHTRCEGAGMVVLSMQLYRPNLPFTDILNCSFTF